MDQSMMYIMRKTTLPTAGPTLVLQMTRWLLVDCYTALSASTSWVPYDSCCANTSTRQRLCTVTARPFTVFSVASQDTKHQIDLYLQCTFQYTVDVDSCCQVIRQQTSIITVNEVDRSIHWHVLIKELALVLRPPCLPKTTMRKRLKTPTRLLVACLGHSLLKMPMLCMNLNAKMS